MKRILSTIFFLLLALSVFAQPKPQTSEELTAALQQDPGRAGGTLYVTDFPSQAAPAPKGYEAVYISHYGRHGARFLTDEKKYDKVMRLFQKGYESGTLTPLGQQCWQEMARIYPAVEAHQGDLTLKGQEQHRGIASRMVKAYPSVFGKKVSVDARSSLSHRAIISMASFLDQIRQMRPKADIQFSSDSADMPVTVLGTVDMDYMKDMGKVFLMTEMMADLGSFSSGFQAEPFFQRLFTDLDTLRSCGEPDKLASDLFEMVNNMQCMDFDSHFPAIFTPQETVQLWEQSNLWSCLFMVDNPYSQGSIAGHAWPLLQDIIDKADEDLAAGSPSVRLRFGHDTVVGPLMAILGIDGWEPVSGEIDSWKYQFQNWSIPMASNVQFIFYRNKKNASDILVRVMYNEKDQILPLPDQRLAPYYRWSDFKAYYTPVCENGERLTNVLFQRKSVENKATDIQ